MGSIKKEGGNEPDTKGLDIKHVAWYFKREKRLVDES